MQTQVTWKPAKDPTGQSTREFVIEREGRRKVTGAVWEADASADTLLLFGHGASGDRYQVPACHLARRLTGEAGLPVMSMDGPVHGLRQVDPGGRVAFAREWRREGVIDDMVDDWQTAIAAVQTLLPRVRRFAYFGLSMGSIFGIPLIASRSDVVVATLGLVGAEDSDANGRRLLADAGRITCPLLFLMQLEDELFSREFYLNVFDRLASKDKRLHANPGLHPEIPAEEIDFAVAFMLGRLRGGVERAIMSPL